MVDFDDMDDNGDQSSSILTEGDRLAWAKHDLLALEDNTKFVHQREKEIQTIVQSISDLNTIFRDLATMIAEQVRSCFWFVFTWRSSEISLRRLLQGTVIDRIDHNIENTQLKVEAGLKQLKKAEQYQKKDKKMHCIVILAVIVIILLIILIVTKT